MKMYKKPIVTVDAGLAEGVYAASGAKGTLNVTYHGVWDRWGTNGGKGLAMADWSGIDGTILWIRQRQTMHLYRLLGQERQRHLHSQVQQVIH